MHVDVMEQDWRPDRQHVTATYLVTFHSNKGDRPDCTQTALLKTASTGELCCAGPCCASHSRAACGDLERPDIGL